MSAVIPGLPQPSSLLALLSVVACGPEPGKDASKDAQRYASSICSTSLKCNCTERFVDKADCESTLTKRFDDVAESLTIDRSCFDTLLAAPLDDCLTGE